MALKENYKDDIFTGNRKYTLIENQDNTISLVDATTYSQEGDTFGADDINDITKEINKIEHTSTITLGTTWTLDSNTNLYYQDVSFTGMTANDKVNIEPVYANKTLAQIEAIEDIISAIKYYDTMSGKIRFYASEQTTTSVDLLVVGV